MSIKSALQGDFLKAALNKVATSNDTKTTVIGYAAAAAIAAGIDWGKLFQKDPNELGKLAGAIVAALFGYYTNKHDQPAPPKQ